MGRREALRFMKQIEEALSPSEVTLLREGRGQNFGKGFAIFTKAAAKSSAAGMRAHPSCSGVRPMGRRAP